MLPSKAFVTGILLAKLELDHFVAPFRNSWSLDLQSFRRQNGKWPLYLISVIDPLIFVIWEIMLILDEVLLDSISVSIANASTSDM